MDYVNLPIPSTGIQWGILMEYHLDVAPHLIKLLIDVHKLLKK